MKLTTNEMKAIAQCKLGNRNLSHTSDRCFVDGDVIEITDGMIAISIAKGPRDGVVFSISRDSLIAASKIMLDGDSASIGKSSSGDPEIVVQTSFGNENHEVRFPASDEFKTYPAPNVGNIVDPGKTHTVPGYFNARHMKIAMDVICKMSKSGNSVIATDILLHSDVLNASGEQSRSHLILRSDNVSLAMSPVKK